jgi:hypothetical protein
VLELAQLERKQPQSSRQQVIGFLLLLQEWQERDHGPCMMHDAWAKRQTPNNPSPSPAHRPQEAPCKLQAAGGSMAVGLWALRSVLAACAVAVFLLFCVFAAGGGRKTPGGGAGRPKKNAAFPVSFAGHSHSPPPPHLPWP